MREDSDPVRHLIEVLSQADVTVEEAGRRMVEVLSGQSLSPKAFLRDPRRLIRPGQDGSRYVAQVAWRALAGDYRTVDEIVSALAAVRDRNPPVIEPRSAGRKPDRAIVPEARILRIRIPAPPDPGERVFEAYVTSGEFAGSDITVRVSAPVNPTAFRAVPLLWVHSSVALYNLVRISADVFEAGRDSFFVLEPLRQANATDVARSLDCPKPEIDRMRRGRGDTTVHTIRGMVVHAILDRLIGGEESLEASYQAAVSPFLGQLASVADRTFDEGRFRDEVLSHAGRLKELIDAHPHMRSDPQVEVRRYSPTIGIQGRIDAVFRRGDSLDIVELKTGRRIRSEDHAQLYIYRLLLSDFVRRTRRESHREIEMTTRLMSSSDGTMTPARPRVGFREVIEGRNRLVALVHALGERRPHIRVPYADYDARVCGKCPSWTRARCREDSERFGDRPGAAVTDDLEYFRRFTTLIRQESWWEGEDLASLLDDSRIADRAREFRTITGARSAGYEGGAFRFEFSENLSELSAGDRVLIHAGGIASGTSYQGYIRALEPYAVRIAIPLHNLDPDTFRSSDEWIIDRLKQDLSSEASQTSLFDFLAAGPDPRKQVVLGDLSPERGRAEDPDDFIGESGSQRSLNSSQRVAVSRAASCKVFHLIWGPPGTGKTRIVPEIIEAAPGDVLLGAFTNTALDNMLMSLLDRDPDASFLRIGRSESSPELAARLGDRASECFSEDLALGASGARDLRLAFDRCPLVAATAHRAASHPYLRGRRFEMAIVDEAGQLTEPLTLGLLMRARRFVLIGDDRQLPPVVRTSGLATSLFERLKHQCAEELPDALTLLEVQYRMHPAIMEVSNRLYYEGRLSSGVGEEERAPPEGGPLVFVPVRAVSSGRANPTEAQVVGDLVRGLLGRAPPESMGVISPFRAQVALLRQVLAGTGVTVDTVERYQGGERDIVLISFVKPRVTDFVFDDRRLNVAITRARRKLILVAHPDLFRDTRFSWVSGFEESTGGLRAP